MKYFRSAFFVLFSLVSNVYGQDDSTFYSKAKSRLIKDLLASEMEQSGLYNGRGYRPHTMSFAKGHPFFKTDKFVSGKVLYRGIYYHDVSMMYDLVKNEVVVPYIDDNSHFSLINEAIAEFSLDGHDFQFLSPEGHPPGFYEKLYAGKTGVWASRSKSIDENALNAEVIEWTIRSRDRYYLLKDGKFTPLTSEGSLLNIAGDRKKELKQYIRTNKLKFKSNFESAIIKLVSYYDKISE